MRCPVCAADDTRVVDSRSADEGAAIRRRRHCGSCGYRFTTFERLEARVLQVRKRSGQRAPFERRKIVSGLSAAFKGRPVAPDVVEHIAAEIEELARRADPPITTEEIGRAVLEHLRAHDQVAYLRFASVYKGFDDVEDFARELRLLEAGDRP
ncbi:MAG: transcriptional repressor NrdR [Acidimicrobiales bacterium]|nr:transcriptional repressor NrdR [Acidimicrobiales bacterium]